MPNNPTDLKYSESHEWVRVAGDVATIGITAYAVEHLGDMVFVDLANVGDTLSVGAAAGTLESVKAAADLLTPVGGTVTERNEAVIDDPGLLNQDAYGTWLVKLTLANPSELDKLLDAAAYDNFEANQ